MYSTGCNNQMYFLLVYLSAYEFVSFQNSLLMNNNSSCSNSSDNCFINSVINQITGIYYFANEGLHGIEAF